MREVRLLLKLAEARKGITPSFTPYHLLRTLLILNEREGVGRPALCTTLKLGEASVKTMLKRLREAELVVSRRPSGTALTPSGRELVMRLSEAISFINDLDVSDLCRDCIGSVAIIRGGEVKLQEFGGVIKARDAVVREGGVGAVILFARGKELMLPVPEGLTPFRGYRLGGELLSKTELREGDAALIALCPKSKNCAEVAINSTLKILGAVDC